MTLTVTKPYPHEYFVTVTGRSSGQKITTPCVDEETALNYTILIRSDPAFVLVTSAFDFFVTFYVTSRDAEMSVKFNEIAGAEEFLRMADSNDDLVVIEYNFISSV